MYFLLKYVSPGIYSLPVKPLRSTVSGNGSLDGEFAAWFGVMSPQAASGAPIDRPCTDVVSSNITVMIYIKLTACVQKNTKHVAIHTAIQHSLIQ